MNLLKSLISKKYVVKPADKQQQGSRPKDPAQLGASQGHGHHVRPPPAAASSSPALSHAPRHWLSPQELLVPVQN